MKHRTLLQAPVPQETLDRVLWADMQPQPAPGQLPLLAHYTSIGTLERIAQTGEIWFSNPLYMNDVDELRYGMGLGLHAVRTHPGLREACPPDHYNALLDAFERADGGVVREQRHLARRGLGLHVGPEQPVQCFLRHVALQ